MVHSDMRASLDQDHQKLWRAKHQFALGAVMLTQMAWEGLQALAGLADALTQLMRDVVFLWWFWSPTKKPMSSPLVPEPTNHSVCSTQSSFLSSFSQNEPCPLSQDRVVCVIFYPLSSCCWGRVISMCCSSRVFSFLFSRAVSSFNNFHLFQCKKIAF